MTRPPATNYAPCYGMGDLFDSTEILDHIQARQICATCPIRATVCRQRAETAVALAPVGGGPGGTWHGELYRGGKVSTAAANEIRRLEEDARYSDTEARRCANLWHDGDRSEWVATGRRVYERRNRSARLAVRQEAS